jgi:DNA-binding CsgD family transcriptional regulator
MKPPGQSNPPPLEVRAEALELLRSKGSVALNEVERLLGWESSFGMTNRQMAQKLDITEGQLKYLLYRDYLRVKAKERRIAESDAKKIAFVTHTSHKLRFSISLPENWRVITDTHEWSRLAQEYLEYFLHSKSKKKPTRFLAYARVSDDGRIRPLTDFEERLVAKEEYEERKANAEQHARLEQMATGIFQAELPDHKDEAFVEVTRLQLDGPLTALDLYELDKYLPEEVPWGSRSKKGMVVDGLSGVVYYHMMHYDDSPQDELVFFNVYLADGLEGWILSCQCRYGDFYFKTFTKYKPIFRHIISSFKRLRIVHTAGTQT